MLPHVLNLAVKGSFELGLLLRRSLQVLRQKVVAIRSILALLAHLVAASDRESEVAVIMIGWDAFRVDLVELGKVGRPGVAVPTAK